VFIDQLVNNNYARIQICHKRMLRSTQAAFADQPMNYYYIALIIY